MQGKLLVVTHNDGAVRIAEDDLRTHVDEFVHEEQARFEHLLVDEHRSLGLCAHHEEHAQQVGRESRPGRIGQRHERAVDEGVYLVVILPGHDDVVVLLQHLDAQAAESVGDDAELVVAHVADADAFAAHGGHADERTHLDHVGQDEVLGAVQTLHAAYGEQVGGDAADVGAHGVEQTAELLDIGLTGGVVDSRLALGQHGGHDDVGRAGDGSLVEQHPGTLETLVGPDVEGAAHPIVDEVGAQLLETQEVRVQTASSDLIAARLRGHGVTVARQQRPEKHHAAPEPGRTREKIVALEIFRIERIGLKGHLAARMTRHLHADVLQETYLVGNVGDVGDVADAHGLRGEQRGAEHLQGFVFRTLGCDVAFERMTAFDDECTHEVRALLSVLTLFATG